MNHSDLPPSSYYELNPVLTPYYRYAPTLVQYYGVIKAIVITEFVLLIIGIVSILFFKFYLDQKERSQKTKVEACTKELLNAVYSEKPFSLKKITKWPFSLLLAAMDSVDSLIIGERWNMIKRITSEALLLPKARSWAKRHYWVKRVMAARSFAFYPSDRDQNLILELVNDPVPIVQYNAIFGATRLGSDKSAETILTAMSHATRFARFPLRDALRRCGAETFAYVENRLSEPISTYEKVSCLEILNGNVYHNIYSTLENQLYDSNKNLRLAAIRVLGNYPLQASINRLIQLLDNSEWEVRAIAASTLGHQGYVAAIPKLTKLLDDKIWWVRVNAATALKKIGKEGIKALEMQDPDIDKFADEISRFSLSN